MKTLINEATATGQGEEYVIVQRGYAAHILIEVILTGTATVAFKVRTAPVGSIEPAPNLFQIVGERLSDGNAVTEATATGLYRIDMTGLLSFVPDVTAYTSGNVTVRVFDAIG